MQNVVQELPMSASGGMILRGAVKDLWSYKGPEAMVAGPAETGKTIGCLLKIHACMLKYPGAQGAILRKTYQSMPGSVLASYEKKILGSAYKTVVKPFGGEKPEWYQYPNGSRLWVGGLDNPDKVLSSERDIVYVNQAEEITLHNWEYLLTRTTGRAGNMPYAQVYGDCNPGPPTHWILHRESLKPGLGFSKHEDNPTLFLDDGSITIQGERTLIVLDSLSGVTKKRLRYGIWAGAEGTVYNDFDGRIGFHVIKRSQVPVCTRRIEIVDFGYTNPFSWQNWHIDHDGRVYVMDQIYFSERMVEDHCANILNIVRGQIKPERILCDHDAEDRATFERYRKHKTRAADKLGIREGIEDMQARLKKAGDGKYRFFVVEDSLHELDIKLKAKFLPTTAIEEVPLYVWNEKKDMPVDEYNHAMDVWRYGVRYLDKGKAKRRRYSGYSGNTI